ncbi:hypothetical protein UFOVP760_112 [uncultured Caudovirales phage]|uniref:Uncharacterized protein n=1 Tax=uncultured Caudovirales phage TaxID=2100421 RepID=A0A6J7XBQ8_9CAUD|nr:hypothetical protein UFOVP760_112 [uncultured Caudovirales phage]
MSYILPSDAIASAIYFSLYLDIKKDIIVSFDYACYGPDLIGSEGFCVFFSNTFAEAIRSGGPGPGLGYSPVSGIGGNDYFGMDAGILGVGFDITGNNGSNRFTDTGYPDVVSNSITLRNGQGENYYISQRTLNLNNVAFKRPISLYEQITDNRPPTFKRVRVRLTDFGQRVVVDMKKVGDYDFVNYLDYTYPEKKSWPKTVRCGVSFATGSVTNTVLKVKGLNINGIYSTDRGEEINTYTYTVDTNSLPGALTYDNPSFEFFNYNDILRVENVNYNDLTNPALTGNPLILVNPVDGPLGAPYIPGNEYVGITNLL